MENDELKNIKEDFKQLRDDMKEFARRLEDDFGKLVKSEGRHLRAKLEPAKERIEDECYRAEEAVKQHPFVTAAVAAALGLVTGALIAGRRD